MKRKILASFAVIMSVCMLGSCGNLGRLQTGRTVSDESKADKPKTEADAAAESAPESVKEEKEEPRETFQTGEAWTVDGQWSLTILGATVTEERNEFSEQTPAAVYVVDYAYSNLGYEDEIMDGLYISLEQQIIDAAGQNGYIYPGSITHYPESVPVGGTCRAQACVGVDNPGTFTINMSIFDNDMNQKKAAFVIDPDKEMVEMPVPNVTLDDSGTLGIGETWTVDGQWSLTLTGVTATDDRNEFDDKNPAAVYIISYDYTNLGYEDEYGDESDPSKNGLFITLDNQIVDSAGVMGYTYAGSIANYPQIIPIGESCHAEECIGLEHPGDFRLSVNMYDSTGKKQKQTFLIKVS